MKKYKPRGFWKVKENVLSEARNHKSVSDWQRASSASCDSARKNGWFDEATAHMHRKVKPSGYWTKRRVLADAKKYETRAEWQRQSGSAYVIGRVNGWLSEATSHMRRPQKPSGYWQIKENVLAEAKKYRSIDEWQKSSSASGASARKNGWFEEATAHMVSNQKRRGYWQVKENVLAEAKKYSKKSEWKKNSNASVQSARKNGWFDEATRHMVISGSRHHRCIYAVRVKGQKICYVGLTYDIKKRFSAHLKSQRFINIAKQYGKKSIYIVQLTAHLPKEEARLMEVKLIAEYEAKGFTMLNKAAGGGLGGDTIKWTRAEVLKEARRYSTITEWMNQSGSSVNAARKNHWFDDATSHMTRKLARRGHWSNKKTVLQDAAKYKTLKEWRDNSVSAYEAAKRQDWFDEAVSHMPRTRVASGHWQVKTNVLNEAQQYSSLTEWQRVSAASVTSARKNGWFDEAKAHMRRAQKPRGYWEVKKHVLDDAKLYRTKTDWSDNSSRAYWSAHNNGWLEEATAHMHKPRRTMGHWQVKENILADAARYSSCKEWRVSSGSAYNACLKMGWLEEVKALWV